MGKIIFKNIDELKAVGVLINESSEALICSGKIYNSKVLIPEFLGASIGVTIGAVTSAALVSTIGGKTTDIFKIKKRLSKMGSIFGEGALCGTMIAGVPALLLGTAGYCLISRRNNKEILKLKEILLQDAIQKNDLIEAQLRKKSALTDDRCNYLSNLNVALKQTIKNLQSDIKHSK